MINQTGYAALDTASGFLPVIAIALAVFMIIMLTIYTLSKQFREFLYGAMITGGLSIVGVISTHIAIETVKENYEVTKWFGYVIAFIFISVIVGKIFVRTKIGKKFEEVVTATREAENNQE